MITGFARILPLIAAGALALPAVAQDDDFAPGRAEYLSACAACHGEDADGNGPLATMLKTPVPDLRTIAARNGGKFPLVEVFHVIDGRTAIRAHGDPMPLFGRRYSAEMNAPEDDFFGQRMVRARVIELAFYLQSLQQ